MQTFDDGREGRRDSGLYHTRYDNAASISLGANHHHRLGKKARTRSRAESISTKRLEANTIQNVKPRLPFGVGCIVSWMEVPATGTDRRVCTLMGLGSTSSIGRSGMSIEGLPASPGGGFASWIKDVVERLEGWFEAAGQSTPWVA